ncbi:variable surface protein [Plasmodium gonderi]|uniref:Variable surface protein n=1 Tax=Plasmodium gonderi TaxID=77519 RepID=A0A1Y1JMW1_PLAGO|nr:variable surface protein [Plasmodium gonderi]GAW83926.1 variable surface protein [Plasmodium gonderi]
MAKNIVHLKYYNINNYIIKLLYKKKFPELKKIMENERHHIDSVTTGNCSSFSEDKYKRFKNCVQKICKEVEYYQQIVVRNYRDELSEYPCIFLYYRLYFYNPDTKKYVSEVKSLYQKLIEDLDLTNCTAGVKSYYSTITDDEMLKLKDLHDMYTYLNNSGSDNDDECNDVNKCAQLYFQYKNSCESSSYSDFCNELKNVRDKYNEIRTLKRKRNKWNNIDEDYNIFQSYKNVRSATMKSRHHIFYNKV